MHKNSFQGGQHRSLLLLVLLSIGFTSLLGNRAMASNEFRAGALLQIPFSLGLRTPEIDPSTIRIGVSCQYANVENDQVLTVRRITNYYNDGGTIRRQVLTGAEVQEDEGNQVFGVEANLLIALFDACKGSAEFLGFYGSNAIQGAAGGGYLFADDFFLSAKFMVPYAEIGLRHLDDTEL